MEVLIVGLTLVCFTALSGAIVLVLYRQKAIKQLGGEKPDSGPGRIKGLWDSIKKGIIRVNKAFTGGKRYGAIAFLLKKLNLDARMGREEFLLIEQCGAAGFFVLGTAATGGVLIPAGLAITGFFLPWLALKTRAREKDSKILAELPDALDIIAANIEGGLSLSAALSRYASRNSNEFSGELLFAIKKIQLGQSSEEAMAAMAGKLDIREVSSFVNAFLQAEKTGGNVKKIIKDQAEEVRKRRFSYLKKLAHEAPVKLLIPLMLFIFPVIFIVLFGPVIIKLMSGF